ncbi:uncharacterized protein LOC116840865 isoform X2 [Odontomachus brunneus]|uniref:uncharacterized protein LOC116840865 isoform X2 n=1 Tax=Odontomachus brunneus TaxID=486640 RepID=UPI0013F295F1|nr:uncharacterized protein LOC116840865 isoform X2 [Odontomachus brunneus]
MTSHVKDSTDDSQNFILQLSKDSTTEDSTSEDMQELTGNNRKERKNDVIVISDTSCSDISSSPKHFEKSEWVSGPVFKSKNKKVKYKKLCISDTSSEDNEEKINLPWRLPVRSDDKSLYKKGINNVQNHKAFYSSDKTTTTSSDMSYDKNIKKQTSKSDIKKSCKNIMLTPVRRETSQSDTVEMRNIRGTNRVTTPSSSGSSNVQNRLTKFTICNTPQQNNAGKVKLTKEDTHKIFKNIISTKVVYDSPRKKGETNVIINESTDVDDDIMHPAILPRHNREANYRNDSFDVIETSLKDNIIPDSQPDSPKLCNQVIIDRPKDEVFHRPLSERKKREIAQWLMTNQSDSQSDSSCSNIPASTRNSINSGNSTLERLELDYETPNNRGKINKVHANEEQTIVTCHEEEIPVISTRQTILDRFVETSKNNNNNPESCTPDRPVALPKTYSDKNISSPSVANRLESADVKNCANILDKLYGKSWRNKADVLLPTTEPRKKPTKTIVKTIQTERKPVLRDKNWVTNLGVADLVKNNIRSDSRKKIQRKHKKQQDSFINDKSLSSDNNESMYHTALTNFRTSTDNMTPKQSYTKPVPVTSSTTRIFSICDTDTEDEINDQSSSDSKKNFRQRKLSFSDDDSSSTSEFDPGDYVPPKLIPKKKTINVPQPPKVATKSKSVTASKFLGHKSFLASLSITVPMNNVHPDARKYRLDYKNLKEELCKKLHKLYNEKVFDNKLPHDMPIEWNVRMRGTAGYCYNKKVVRSLTGIVRSSRIALATKILDTPDRLRDTLIHEMCHAAAWLINEVSDGHGPFWTEWANKAMRTFPELPPIRRCHDYEIKTKFTYKCTGCGYSIGRHSKSLDIEKKRCGHCYGKFELLVNKTTKSGTVQVQTPKREPSGFALYVKQNYNSVKKEKNIKHADVMKILGIQM